MNPPPKTAVVEPEPASLTQAALKDLLSRHEMALQHDALFTFYQMRSFRPAWSGSENNQELVRAALGLAHEQGLRDEDYRLPRQSAVKPGVDAAQYDIAITGAVLRYARDVRTGRTRPNQVYEDVELPTPGFDAAADLTQTLSANRLADFFVRLPPAHQEYRQLAAALAHYRAIAAKGGWPALTGPNEILFDGKDARLKALQLRLAAEDSNFAAVANPSRDAFRDAVKRYQTRNGLTEDGRVRGDTLATLNISAATRAEQIAANMERWRWLAPFESRYVAVNVPDESVAFMHDGEALLTSRVIIGRKASPTPITRSEITAVVVNPPWDIPGDIAARDLLPQLKRNPNYLATKNMVVTNGPKGDRFGRKIDWKKVVPAEFPYAIQQLPGPATALGVLMLDSPNDFDVYLHDTPNKKLFDPREREVSNGCVRVQQIFPLASLALTDDPMQGMGKLNAAVRTHQTQRISLDAPLPVYFLYWTTIPEADGTVGFRPDRYGRDIALIGALKGTPRPHMEKANATAKPMDELSP
jgi:murein L,D-transpeptidase YcbB/YkuD